MTLRSRNVCKATLWHAWHFLHLINLERVAVPRFSCGLQWVNTAGPLAKRKTVIINGVVPLSWERGGYRAHAWHLEIQNNMQAIRKLAVTR